MKLLAFLGFAIVAVNAYTLPIGSNVQGNLRFKKSAGYSAPSYSAPSSSYSAPAYNAPCPKNYLFSCQPSVAPVPCQAPSYSAPAPVYSAPAPVYSAPAPAPYQQASVGAANPSSNPSTSTQTQQGSESVPIPSYAIPQFRAPISSYDQFRYGQYGYNY